MNNVISGGTQGLEYMLYGDSRIRNADMRFLSVIQVEHIEAIPRVYMPLP